MKMGTLKEFLHLAESLNFSETARFFYINQPSLSKHIQELEAELGAILFLRNNHSVRLTDTGKLFVGEAKAVVAAHDHAINTIAQEKQSFESTLTIGFLFGASRQFLSLASKRFAEIHPEVKTSFFSLEADPIVEALKDNSIDLGIGMLRTERPSPLFEYHRIFQDSFVLMIPQSHQLATKNSINVHDLKEELIIPSGFPAQADLTDFIVSQLHKSGVAFQISEVANDRDSLPFIMQGHSSLILHCGHMEGFHGSYYKFVPLEGIDLGFSVSAFWKKSKVKTNVLDFVKCIDSAMETIADFEEKDKVQKVSTTWKTL